MLAHYMQKLDVKHGILNCINTLGARMTAVSAYAGALYAEIGRQTLDIELCINNPPPVLERTFTALPWCKRLPGEVGINPPMDAFRLGLSRPPTHSSSCCMANDEATHTHISSGCTITPPVACHSATDRAGRKRRAAQRLADPGPLDQHRNFSSSDSADQDDLRHQQQLFSRLGLASHKIPP